MHIIINHSSMVPIYEQIMDQVKAAITSGELKADTALPSVRNLARELKISALTVKKAYDFLEEEGFTVTVQGKGTYVAAGNRERIKEEQRRLLETELEEAVERGRSSGISDEEIREIFRFIMEE
ncbi:MAG: GntR family transcriptional regulator [Agathobacter sp.]